VENAADSNPPPRLWREELKRAWIELRGGDLSPGRAAAAVAIGLFIGSQPIFGCHTPLVLTFCILLKLDAALAWVASNISNPFFAPFLVTAEVQLGGYLWTGAAIPFDQNVARETGISGFAAYAFSGAPIIGLGLAALGAVTVYGIVATKQRLSGTKPRLPYRLPDAAPAWWHATERLAARYAAATASTAAERSRFHYVRVKLLMDPVSRMIADAFGTAPEVLGDVLDIGTGRGQLPLVLLELGRARTAHGFDWDDDKIAAAKLAANQSPALAASFETEDAVESALEPADTVLLIDVLHYLQKEEQDALLTRAARAVRPGGRVVIREADTKRGLRSWLTLAEELVFTAIRFNRGARVRFRSASDIVAQLTAEGLSCEVRPAWGKTPFANVLIIGTRAAKPS